MVFQIALSCGLLFAGVNAYRKQKKKKEMPWTFYAEKMKKKEKKKKKRKKKSASVPLGKSMPTRRQQLKEISSLEDERKRNEAEEKAERNLVIASGSFGLSIVGATIYPPAIPLSMLGMIYIYRYFFVSTYKAIVNEGKLNIDTLLAVNTTLFLLSGHYVIGNFNTWIWACYAKLLTRIEDNSRKDFIDVFRSQARSVWVLSNGSEIEVPFDSLNGGDIVVVHAGETIPIDGSIVEGRALIDQHILTGESQPAEKGEGDDVFALTVVLFGKLHISTEKTGNETISAQIGQILNETVDFKTGLQLRAEKISDQSVLPTLLLSGASYPLFGTLVASMSTIYANPNYRLLISTSFGILSYFNLASKKGLLIKDGRTLELLNQVDTVVFDKTGTLTQEQPHVGQIHTCHGYGENDILSVAAAAEDKQTHPIAKAIQQKALAMQLSLPDISDAEYKIGYGLTVSISEQLVRVGSARFIEMEGVPIPPTIREKQAFCHQEGHSLVLVAINNEVAGAIELHSTVRPEAKATIQKLREHHGIKSMAIISGDHEAPTKKLALKLGIEHYFSEVLPEDKANLITQLQAEGKSVCYVGDGINDAIALKKANVSISLRGASTVATDTAQVILMNQKLDQLEQLFELAQDYEANMKNIFATVITPSLIGLGGVFFLHYGLSYMILMSQIGFVGGIGVALSPLLQHKLEKESHKKDSSALPSPVAISTL